MNSEAELMLWVAKYRPRTVQECILPDRLKKPFQGHVDKKFIPNLVLSGKSGVGKTTIAMAMCEELGMDYIMINASNESGIDTLRVKIRGYASSVSLTGGRKVIIVDEADGLSKASQMAFRGVIEEFEDNCSFIFTCNYKNMLVGANLSRTANIEFKLKKEEKAKMASLFMKRVCEILDLEKVTYDPKVIVEVIKKYFPDYRRILNELQSYSSIGQIDSGILAANNNLQAKDLIKIIANKDFSAARKWVSENTDVDAELVYRDVYDNLNTILKKESVPAAVLLLAKYQYQAAFVADQEINMLAFLTELMIETEAAE